MLVPAVPEAFVYDADGNLLQDRLWIYEWDADGARQRGDGAPKARPQGCRVRVLLGRTRQQNRLIAQELRSDVSAATWKRLEYKYDREGRRVQKLVKTKTTPSGSWTTASDTRFLYDGWNLIAEYSYTGSAFTLLRSHVWGLDLSGTPQGAGGVGGLLWTTVAATSKTYAAAADANGNVIAYVDCADGSVAGKRDYGAFGEAVITTGVAGSLPFGFSSKYEEKESGLYYYGMRFYAPSTGRWLSRDPIGENGGLNLYGMVGNDPLDKVDMLGAMITYPTPIVVDSFGIVPGLAKRMLLHYMARSGSEFTLSRTDVISLKIQPDLDIFLHDGVMNRLMKVVQTMKTEVIIESDNAIRHSYTTSSSGNNSLGAFIVRAKGSIKCRNETGGIAYVFEGDFRVEDRYDFENYWEDHRSFFGNVKTTAMEFLVPGVAFEVRSVWIPVEQTFGKAPIW